MNQEIIFKFNEMMSTTVCQSFRVSVYPTMFVYDEQMYEVITGSKERQEPTHIGNKSLEHLQRGKKRW